MKPFTIEDEAATGFNQDLEEITIDSAPVDIQLSGIAGRIKTAPPKIINSPKKSLNLISLAQAYHIHDAALSPKVTNAYALQTRINTEPQAIRAAVTSRIPMR